MCTLTYVYADSTVVVGPLATHAEPHAYDLCDQHAERLSAPRGWEVVRLNFEPAPAQPAHDDLLALADAVREAGRTPTVAPAVAEPAAPETGVTEVRRLGHLRVLSTD